MSEEINRQSQAETQSTDALAQAEAKFQFGDQALPQNSELPMVTDALSGALRSEERVQRESYLTGRLHQIRSGYEGLSTKQKDVLQLGAMALSTTILPVIGIIDGGHHVQASEHFLQWEGLGGLYALTGAAAVKFHRMTKRYR